MKGSKYSYRIYIYIQLTIKKLSHHFESFLLKCILAAPPNALHATLAAFKVSTINLKIDKPEHIISQLNV